jgi:hypothetical protein
MHLAWGRGEKNKEYKTRWTSSASIRFGAYKRKKYNIRGGLISLWLNKENNKLWDWKNVFTLHIPPWATHTYDFVVLTSLTHPRKIVLVVLKTGKTGNWKSQRLISTPTYIQNSRNEIVWNRMTRRSRNISGSYSDITGFESRTEHRLPWLRFFVVLLYFTRPMDEKKSSYNI